MLNIFNIIRRIGINSTKKNEVINREIDVYHNERDLKGADCEFLIRRIEDFEFSDDFIIKEQDLDKVLTPNDLKHTDFKLLDYEYCEYRLINTKISIVSEFVGIQVTIENNEFPRETVKKILEDIRNNIQTYTNHSAQILEV